MTSGASRAVRAALVLASTAAASGAAWWLWPHLRPERESLAFVDNSAELEAFRSRRPPRAERVGATLAELGRELADGLRDVEREGILVLSPPLLRARRTGQRVFAVPAPGVLYGHPPNRAPRQEFAEHPEGGFERRTNARGWREDADLGEKRGPRVLVIGDSHVAGVVRNVESFPNVLEARRRAGGAEGLEVWNAAVGGYGPANYLGAVTAYGDLDLDALVVTIYGGNDLREALTLWSLVYGSPGIRDAGDLTAPVAGLAGGPGLLGQELLQACTFALSPDAVDEAERAVAATMVELARQCRERGIEFLVVYLPPPSLAQPEIYAARIGAAAAATGLGSEILAVPDRIADAALARLAEEGVTALDLRPVFARCPEPLYWNTDLHLNVAGHRLVAEAVDAALGEVTRR